jgi:hypothetical protein
MKDSDAANEERSAWWSAGSAAAGAFVAGVIPDSWPWTYELAVVLVLCLAVFVLAKAFGRK